MDNQAGPSDYAIPKPTKIKMKETKPETAHRLYLREQRRQAREASRISRANGYAVSPPRRGKDESISPPRKAARRPSVHGSEDEGVGGGEWMGGYGRKAKEELDRREWREKMSWLAGEGTEFGEGSDPFGAGWVEEDIRIPQRFRDAAGIGGSSSSSSERGRRRDPAAEIDLSSGSGAIPSLGSMSEAQYTTFIREGMYRLKHRAELEEAAARQRKKEEKERLREAEAEKRQREEEKKLKKLKERKSEDVERGRKDERRRWGERWKGLVQVGGEVESTQLGFGDVPWPVYRSGSGSERTKRVSKTSVEDLSKDAVRSFLFALADDTEGQAPAAVAAGGDRRKVIREAIRLFHPDRFHGRILPRVSEAEKERVKEGVEVVSRVLNDLASEVR